MKNYNDVSVSTEILQAWKDTLERRFDYLCKRIGPGLSYRVLTQDYGRLGAERVEALVKKAKLKYESEQRKVNTFKVRTVAELERRKNAQKLDEARK